MSEFISKTDNSSDNMSLFYILKLSLLLLCLSVSCDEANPKKTKPKITKETIVIPSKVERKNSNKKVDSLPIRLNTDNAIPFFYQYAKTHKSNKVRIVVRNYGNIDLLLYEQTPYHRANFIYLAKQHYFDGSCFHRVIPSFVIQGGNSDEYSVRDKRIEIGRYLLPPDAKRGYKHNRGTISMPSSDIDNPYQMASPYEFFIVVQAPGAYHLDGKYTAFGKVIKGMSVVDSINKVDTDDRDWPLRNVIINRVEVLN